MPELPEVEAARRAIEENCLGKKIKRVIIADDNKVIHGISPSDFQISILGKTIVSARRKGKNLWLELDSPPFPSFQFGMAGAIYIKGVAVTKYKRSAVKDSEEWPSKYSKFFVELDDGLELSFTDKRRFAKVRLLENPTSVSPISELGPDALLEPMTVEEFAENLAKKKITIKPLLLDQGFISGIGNWIADEVLYQARIHPLQSASSLSKEQCEALHTSIKEVIQHAVQVSADSKEFPVDWLFHFRWGKKAGKVNGKKIDFITAGGRTTAYVPELQKLSGKDAEKAAKVRPAKRGVKPKEDDGEGEEDEQESEKEDESAKTKKGQKPRGGRGKKPASKRKTEDSDDEDDDADGGDDSEAEEKVVKPRGRGTKPATKRKSEEKATSQAGKKPKGRKS
ncbi:formamidopyrimidine-DNA glycosylase isoform X2 [Arabidopsis lyrata subsp. lyrata]|uniref:formamidopyrimidine-DNA glycosylase isoform X2 n=1 Tax=Arabidopsis lyrata subsp. lyrata TaxID=81972 RepID=UPI000A29D21E|nr:formamidopyrimidine-DNA glycosylase isoform X2 [Arabidopsis lyrata subsp. lyrata]|eukprot:XP_020868691.1 formamidopyrimidine-DNA glycosylase isoform X2 [Arabidopsis lyrata subsp. lyrata]